MKMFKHIVSLIALSVGVLWLTACSRHLVATGPPMPPTEVVVVAPSPRHIWVPGYYDYRGGNYVYMQGSYQVPPRGSTSYSQGQWQQTPRGYRRVRGYWK